MSTSEEDKIRSYILTCREEAESAKRDRMDLNEDNFDQYHLKHDFSHKREGQSTEVLPRVRMSTEQTKSFFQQALVSSGDWWRCEPSDGSLGEGMAIRPYEIFKLTNFKMNQADFHSHVGNCIQSALLGALAVSKTAGCLKSKPKYVARKKGRGKKFTRWLEKAEEKTWELKYDLISQRNYYPDPTGAGLYKIEESFVDLHVVKKLAEDPYAIYDKKAVKDLKGWSQDLEEDELSRETGQNPRTPQSRPQVKVTEFWGTVLDYETGDVLHENVVITLANDEVIIRKPTPNPLWHQRDPITAAALLEVGNSVWHTALMDAGTKHNRTLTEVINLMIDAAMQAIHNITQIRVDDLVEQNQISDGIKPGMTLQVRSSLPPGAKIMEAVSSGNIPPEVVTLYNLLSQESNAAMLTNDLRQGVMPFRSVKATEVVEASNTITSVFQGIIQNVEKKLIQPLLELSWMTVAQNWDLIDPEEFKALFGEDRGEQLSQLSPEEVFASTVGGIKFHVFGLSVFANKAADFRKYTTFLQTVGSSEVLMEEFLKAGNSFGKLLEEIMHALDIQTEKLKDPNAKFLQEEAGESLEQPGAAPGATPNQASQQPQAGSGSLADLFGTGGAEQEILQQQNYPGSRALSNQGGGQ